MNREASLGSLPPLKPHLIITTARARTRTAAATSTGSGSGSGTRAAQHGVPWHGIDQQPHRPAGRQAYPQAAASCLPVWAARARLWQVWCGCEVPEPGRPRPCPAACGTGLVILPERERDVKGGGPRLAGRPAGSVHGTFAFFLLILGRRDLCFFRSFVG